MESGERRASRGVTLVLAVVGALLAMPAARLGVALIPIPDGIDHLRIVPMEAASLGAAGVVGAAIVCLRRRTRAHPALRFAAWLVLAVAAVGFLLTLVFVVWLFRYGPKC